MATGSQLKISLRNENEHIKQAAVGSATVWALADGDPKQTVKIGACK